MDELLTRLRRVSAEDPRDLAARFRYRLECVRIGRAEMAGLEVGDVVWVDEVESPWICGGWRGEVLKVFEAGDKYVRPLDRAISYRVRPSPEYLAKGLYLTRQDRTRLVEPAAPFKQARVQDMPGKPLAAA